jgi:hypothetical protein
MLVEEPTLIRSPGCTWWVYIESFSTDQQFISRSRVRSVHELSAIFQPTF